MQATTPYTDIEFKLRTERERLSLSAFLGLNWENPNICCYLNTRQVLLLLLEENWKVRVKK